MQDDSERAQTEAPLIGAQLIPLALAITDRILKRVHEAGFIDLRRGQLTILRHLWPQSRRITDLADRTGLTKPSVVYLVDYLERRGYVERTPDPQDGRAVLVRYRERGWALHHIARSAVQEVQDEWTRAIGKQTMEAFLKTLGQLSQLASPAASGDAADMSPPMCDIQRNS
jgi:DNA-binding MarR family transcriptional regulator